MARSGLRRVAGPVVVALCWLVPAAHAGVPATPAQAVADREIVALIEGLARSGCRFQRNGRWHEAAAASRHLQRKYDWARERGMDGSAEDFIEQAASRSSFSGSAYRVACPGQAESDAGPWFKRRLDAMRRGGRAR